MTEQDFKKWLLAFNMDSGALVDFVGEAYIESLAHEIYEEFILK